MPKKPKLPRSFDIIYWSVLKTLWRQLQIDSENDGINANIPAYMEICEYKDPSL